MSYEEFAAEFIEGLRTSMDPSVEFDRRKVKKVNEELDGLTVKFPDTAISPTIYLEDRYQMYEDGYTMDQLIESTVAMINGAYENAPSMPELTEEAARKSLYCVVVNAEKNEDMLRNVPHDRLEDLAVIPRYRVSDNASFIVTNDMCGTLKMTGEEVLEAAHANTNAHEYECQGMSEILRNIMMDQGMPDDYIEDFIQAQDMEANEVMYVVTDESKAEAAAAITSENAMQSAYEKIKKAHPDMNDMYVLGSSRHELILVPDDAVSDEEFLRSMHKEVQDTQLSNSDKLTDCVYKYNANTRQITIVDAPVMAQEQAMEVTRSHARAH